MYVPEVTLDILAKKMNISCEQNLAKSFARGELWQVWGMNGSCMWNNILYHHWQAVKLVPWCWVFHPPFLWPGSWSSGPLKEIPEERFASFPSFFSMPMRVVWAFPRICMGIGISVRLNSWIGKLFLRKLRCYEMTKVWFENKNSTSTSRDGQGLP